MQVAEVVQQLLGRTEDGFVLEVGSTPDAAVEADAAAVVPKVVGLAQIEQAKKAAGGYWRGPGSL